MPNFQGWALRHISAELTRTQAVFSSAMTFVSPENFWLFPVLDQSSLMEYYSPPVPTPIHPMLQRADPRQLLTPT